MTREQALKKLNKAIVKVSKLQDDEFHLSVDISKIPKCPKCGTLKDKGYRIGDACGYTFASCKCGYRYDDY